MSGFRFEGLDVWIEAQEVGILLCKIADDLEDRKLYRFSEQMRGAALSISNNIAEGSGSRSAKDFRAFLNIARRSVFEDANMLIFFSRQGLLSRNEIDPLLERLRVLSARIAAFSSSLE